MAKKKTRAELKEDLKAVKEEAKVARQEKRDFEKTNKLEKGADHSGDAKNGKKWIKLNDMVTKKEKQVEDAQKQYDEAKPEKVARVSKYDYPLSEATGKEMTADEKKKYRTKARAAAAKAAKGETEGTKKSSKKKEGKKEEKKGKSDKKKLKPKKVEEADEADDDLDLEDEGD